MWLPPREQQPGDNIWFPGLSERTQVQPSTATHPAPGLDALVDEVREGFPGDVPP